MQITLAISPGACSRVPLIALEETGADFETRLIRFRKGDHRSPQYLRQNPAGKVPLLIVDGKPLSQNVAILTFLASIFPEAMLLPASNNAFESASILAKLAWCASDLHQLVTRVRIPTMSCDVPEAAERTREMAADAMALQLQPLEADLDAQPWFLGSQWSVLDAYIYWVWFRITGAGFPADLFPSLTDHTRRMEDRPAVQRALACEAAAQTTLEDEGLAVRFPVASQLQLKTTV